MASVVCFVAGKSAPSWCLGAKCLNVVKGISHSIHKMVILVLGNVDSVIALILLPAVGAKLGYGVFAGRLNENPIFLNLGYAVDNAVLAFYRRREPCYTEPL